jgi:hypothetical protein
VIGGNVFNLLFGRVYDSNTVSSFTFLSTHTDPQKVGRIGSPEAGVASAVEVVRSLLKRDTATLPSDSSHDCMSGCNSRMITDGGVYRSGGCQMLCIGVKDRDDWMWDCLCFVYMGGDEKRESK